MADTEPQPQPYVQSPDERPKLRRRLWVGTGMAVFFGVAAGASGVLTVTFIEESRSVVSLATLMLGGVLTFFFAIAAMVAVYHSLKLSTPDEALGLPRGSVRALIALVLIFLFFLMAVFLYLDVSLTATNTVLRNQTKEQLDSIDPNSISAVTEHEVVVSTDPDNPQTETRFDVFLVRNRETSPVAEDIARQLITTIGTLIVAIAAFYFGVGSVSTAEKTLRRNGSRAPLNETDESAASD